MCNQDCLDGVGGVMNWIGRMAILGSDPGFRQAASRLLAVCSHSKQISEWRVCAQGVWKLEKSALAQNYFPLPVINYLNFISN